MTMLEVDAAGAELAEQGIVLLPGLLSPERVQALNDLVDRIMEQEGRPESLNVYQAAFKHPEVLELIQDERALELVVNLLGYNLQLSSSLINVRQPVAREDGQAFAGRKLPATSKTGGGSLNWHRDGPSPRFPHIDDFSAKVAFCLTDLSQPERGNTKVIPGSHNVASFRPEHADSGVPVAGEVQVLAAPGDAYVFTQNLWHSAPRNYSDLERRMIFIGYSACWTRPLDYDVAPAHLREAGSPILRQLLGEVGPTTMHYWMPDSTPLEKYWHGGEVTHGYA